MAFVRPITCTFGDAGQEGAGCRAAGQDGLVVGKQPPEGSVYGQFCHAIMCASMCVSLCVYCLHTAYIYIHVCTYLQCVCVCGGQDHSCMNKIFNIFLKFSFVYANYLSRTLFGAAATAVASRITSWLISSLSLCVCVCVTSVACTFFINNFCGSCSLCPL